MLDHIIYLDVCVCCDIIIIILLLLLLLLILLFMYQVYTPLHVRPFIDG